MKYTSERDAILKAENHKRLGVAPYNGRDASTHVEGLLRVGVRDRDEAGQCLRRMRKTMS